MLFQEVLPWLMVFCLSKMLSSHTWVYFGPQATSSMVRKSAWTFRGYFMGTGDMSRFLFLFSGFVLQGAKTM